MFVISKIVEIMFLLTMHEVKTYCKDAYCKLHNCKYELVAKHVVIANLKLIVIKLVLNAIKI